MKLTKATAVAIATATSQVRDDWDHAGILHALRVEADKGTHAEDVFVAIAQLAANREARTPGLLNKPGRHWTKAGEAITRRGDHNEPCPDHPDHDMPCSACSTTRYVPTDEDRAAWRNALAEAQAKEKKP